MLGFVECGPSGVENMRKRPVGYTTYGKLQADAKHNGQSIAVFITAIRHAMTNMYPPEILGL